VSTVTQGQIFRTCIVFLMVCLTTHISMWVGGGGVGTGTDERFFVHVRKKSMPIQKNLDKKNLQTKFLDARLWDFASGNAVHNISCTFTVIMLFFISLRRWNS
jgi:hypothetical protein